MVIRTPHLPTFDIARTWYAGKYDKKSESRLNIHFLRYLNNERLCSMFFQPTCVCLLASIFRALLQVCFSPKMSVPKDFCFLVFAVYQGRKRDKRANEKDRVGKRTRWKRRMCVAENEILNGSLPICATHTS